MIDGGGAWALYCSMQRVARVQVYFAKGHYFSIPGNHPFKHLVYPMPSDGGLGVHLTMDLAGQLKAGPDVEWLDHDDPQSIDYSVPAAREAAFLSSIRQYWPEVPAEALQADYSGVRAKLHRPGEVAADFMIQTPDAHGAAGAVQRPCCTSRCTVLPKQT